MFPSFGAWRQCLAAVICTLSVATVSNSYFFLEPLIERLLTDEFRNPLTPTETSWLVSIVELGELIVSVPAGLLADKIGRRGALLTVGPTCILAWTLVLSTDSLGVLFAVRVIQGAATGVAFAVAPMYIAEVAGPKIRGRLSGIFQVMWSAGMLFTYLTGPYLRFHQYIWVCATLPMAFTVLFILMPESPYYLLMKKRGVESHKALAWLRGTNDVDSELDSIAKSVAEDMARKGGWKDLVATPHDRKVLFTVQLICSIKYLVGTTAVNSYAATTFVQSTSSSPGSEHTISIAMGAIAVASAVASAFMSDSVGRRPLLILSSLVVTILNVVIGVYFYLEARTPLDVSPYNWVMYASVAGTLVITNIGIGPLTQTVQAEMFPSHTRAIGGGVTGLTSSVTTFIVLKQFQTVMDLFGMYMNFVIFAGFGLIGTGIMCIVLRETAGKSLSEIQKDQKGVVEHVPRDTAGSYPNHFDGISLKSV